MYLGGAASNATLSGTSYLNWLNGLLGGISVAGTAVGNDGLASLLMWQIPRLSSTISVAACSVNLVDCSTPGPRTAPSIRVVLGCCERLNGQQAPFSALSLYVPSGTVAIPVTSRGPVAEFAASGHLIGCSIHTGCKATVQLRFRDTREKQGVELLNVATSTSICSPLLY